MDTSRQFTILFSSRHRFAVLATLFLCIGCELSFPPGCAPDECQFQQDPDSGIDSPFEIKLATYNVNDFDLDGTADSQADHVARFVAEMGIDVIVLEEVQTEDQSEFSAALEAVDYAMDFVAVSSMSDGYNAIGVWSRYPISTEEILTGHVRRVLRVDAQVSDVSTVSLYGCHLKSGTGFDDLEERINQARELEVYLKKNHDPNLENVVVLGDMNTMSEGDWTPGGTMDALTLKSDNPGAPENDFIPVNHTYLPDQWTNPGWESLLDHIILSPHAMDNYVEGSVQILHPKGDGPFGPSDHYPVHLTLAL